MTTHGKDSIDIESHEMKEITESNYVFNPTLINFLEDQLLYFKNNKMIDEKIETGENISKNEYTELNKTKKLLQRRKVDILDKHVFRSMANLIIFFKYIAENDELRELFEDDIKELFGYIREPRNSIIIEDQSRYNERHYIIRRFLDPLLKWDIEKDPNNFRLDLFSALQQIISDNFNPILHRINESKVNTDPNNKNKMNLAGLEYMAESDIRRALYWLDFLGSRYTVSEYEQDKNSKPKRPIQF